MSVEEKLERLFDKNVLTASWSADAKRLMVGWVTEIFNESRPCGEWTPITYRPMDEEEYEDFKKEFGELPIEERKMFSCPMPEDDQEILICTSWGRVSQDRCVMDECGYGLEENGDWDGIVAWMPLPEPYKEVGEKDGEH